MFSKSPVTLLRSQGDPVSTELTAQDPESKISTCAPKRCLELMKWRHGNFNKRPSQTVQKAEEETKRPNEAKESKETNNGPYETCRFKLNPRKVVVAYKVIQRSS